MSSLNREQSGSFNMFQPNRQTKFTLHRDAKMASRYIHSGGQNSNFCLLPIHRQAGSYLVILFSEALKSRNEIMLAEHHLINTVYPIKKQAHCPG